MLRLLTASYRRFSSWNHANLSAPYWRVYWNDAPGWFASLKGAEVALGPDRLLAIPPETPFAARSENECGHLYLHFVAERPYAQARLSILSRPAGNHTGGIVHELVSLLSSGREAGQRAQILAYQLCLAGLAMVPAGEWQDPRFDPRIAAAIATMELHVDHPVDNDTLAREAGMNGNAFIRLFKTQTGLTPQAWHTRHRIDYACELLHHTRLGIKEIADRTGYCDRAHFSRVFAAHRGVGPASFRTRGVPDSVG
jgi:AraC-like DNA-binding protein